MRKEEKLDLYEHRENVPQVAVFVHRRQVVQDALCKYWNLGDDNDEEDHDEVGDDKDHDDTIKMWMMVLKD